MSAEGGSTYFDFWILGVRIKRILFLKEEVSLCLWSENPHPILNSKVI
jgi:hypothetical protein